MTEDELLFEVVETTNKRGYEPIPKPGGDLMIKIGGKPNDANDKLIFKFDGDPYELTKREAQLRQRVENDPRKVPDDAEPGDTYKIDEILDDLRTPSEIREDAISRARDIAHKSGENIVIQTAAAECRDPMRECFVDKVIEFVTPFGRREKKRLHTTRHDSAGTFFDKLDIDDRNE